MPPRRSVGSASFGFRIPHAVVAVTLIGFALGLLFGGIDISTVVFADEQGAKGLAGVVLAALSFGSFLGGIAYGSREWKMPLERRLVAVAAIATSSLLGHRFRLRAQSVDVYVEHPPVQPPIYRPLSTYPCSPMRTRVDWRLSSEGAGMSKLLKITCGVVLAAILLAGCRYNATYTINADDTVSGRIYTAIYQDPAADPVDASVKSDADSIAASFTTATETPHNEGSWVGYYVYFTNEPLATFGDPPTTTWDVQILKVGGQYQVFGYTATDENPTRTSATDNSGYLELDVYFPGTLVEATGASESSVSPGWAHFNLLTQPLSTTPYAKGNGPAAPPAPEPVHTVVITPVPEPVVTLSASPSANPSPSSSVTPTASDGGSGIPMWVWAVGGALLAVIAGLIGVMVANRKPKEPTAPAVTAPAVTAPAVTAPAVTAPDVKPNTDADPTI